MAYMVPIKCVDCVYGVVIDERPGHNATVECHRHAPENTLKDIEEAFGSWPIIRLGKDNFCGDGIGRKE